MKYEQKIKQLEKFLIIKKVNDNQKSNLGKSSRLLMREQAIKARSNEMQEAINKNFNTLLCSYDFQKDNNKTKNTEKFIKHFLDLDNEVKIKTQIQKLPQIQQIKTELSSQEYLPSIDRNIQPTQCCDNIIKTCQTVRNDLKKLKRVNKKTIKTNNTQMNKILTKLVVIQTANFLNNELIIL